MRAVSQARFALPELPFPHLQNGGKNSVSLGRGGELGEVEPAEPWAGDPHRWRTVLFQGLRGSLRDICLPKVTRQVDGRAGLAASPAFSGAWHSFLRSSVRH